MYLARVYGKHAAARLGTWSWQATDVVHFDFLPPELRKCSWPTAARYEWRRNDSSSPSRFFALGAAAGPPRAFSHTRLLWQLRRADMCAGVHQVDGTSAHPRNPSGCSTLPNAWVEVTHTPRPGEQSRFPWFYVARGSGVSLNVGRTAAVRFSSCDERVDLSKDRSALSMYIPLAELAQLDTVQVRRGADRVARAWQCTR